VERTDWLVGGGVAAKIVQDIAGDLLRAKVKQSPLDLMRDIFNQLID
jgi:hypothetical protein